MKWPFNINFAKDTPKKPNMTEQGKSERSAIGSSSLTKDIQAINDDLTAKSGTDIYDELKHDPDVKSGLMVKIGGVLSRGWELTIDEKYGTQGEAIKEFVQYNFDAMPGSLDDRLEEILRDLLVGGTSIAEKLWAYSEEGDYNGKVLMSNLKPKDPDVFVIDVDEFDNIEALKLNLAGSKTEVDLNKFCIATYQAEHGEPYGTSDLRSAYYWYRLKKMFIKWWACYAEKYGMPTAKGTVPAGTSDAKKTEFLSVLSKIQQQTAILVEEEQMVELLSATQNSAGGNGDYLAAIEFFGKQIIKSILGQTLTSDEGTSSGSYALGKVHESVLQLYIKKLKRMIEQYVDEQLTRDIVDYNFSDKIYPNFSLRLDDKDIDGLTAMGDMIANLGRSGLIHSSQYEGIDEMLSLPHRDMEAQMAEEQAAKDNTSMLNGLFPEPK